MALIVSCLTLEALVAPVEQEALEMALDTAWAQVVTSRNLSIKVRMHQPTSQPRSRKWY